MNKRPFGDSSSPGPQNATGPSGITSDQSSLATATQDASSYAQSLGYQAAKKPRHFVASIACENCRLKKSKCDESRPKCSSCIFLGVECIYRERKESKQEQSLSMVISMLHRIETKLENLPSTISKDTGPVTNNVPPAVDIRKDDGRTKDIEPSLSSSIRAFPAIDQREVDPGRKHEIVAPNGHISISFSQHRVLRWPGARGILPRRLLSAHDQLGSNYVIDLEESRAPLPMYVSPFPVGAGDHWLESLPLVTVKGLVEAFFATYNPITPILDMNFFSEFTLGAVIKDGFGYSMETCLVLNVMAMGCLAVRAHQEGNFSLPGSVEGPFVAPAWLDAIEEEPAGLRFFNEARRRIGFIMCENNLQSCQYYLLSAMYYAQIIRPMDSWSMINRAASCCLAMLTNKEIDYDDWEGDMKSRVYWNTVMNEAILAQELDLPATGVSRLEDYVPIPKFISSPAPRLFIKPAHRGDIASFQYHFLAQVAHRIILTRIRDSLYVFSESGNLPRPALNAEMHHQIEQWRLNLPRILQFSDQLTENADHTATSPSSAFHRIRDANTGASPAAVIADAMLRGRYRIAKFHIGRPYLYKALSKPESLTEHDIEQVRSGLKYAMDWPIARGLCRQMMSCVPIRFSFCSQFFGQILIFYCISHSPEQRLKDTLPEGWELWYKDMFSFIEDCAPYSPAITKDLELLRLL